MSAAEIIEEIKKLPREEQQKVAAFVDAAKVTGKKAQASEQNVGEEFKQVADEVFTTNAELFCKLAQ